MHSLHFTVDHLPFALYLAFFVPQLIATACLFLAAKVEESPKPLRQVIIEVERVRHAKNIQVGGGRLV